MVIRLNLGFCSLFCLLLVLFLKVQNLLRFHIGRVKAGRRGAGGEVAWPPWLGIRASWWLRRGYSFFVLLWLGRFGSQVFLTDLIGGKS